MSLLNPDARLFYRGINDGAGFSDVAWRSVNHK